MGVYCQICTTLPVDSRPEGTACHSCGKYACSSHGKSVSGVWYCNSCAPAGTK